MYYTQYAHVLSVLLFLRKTNLCNIKRKVIKVVAAVMWCHGDFVVTVGRVVHYCHIFHCELDVGIGISWSQAELPQVS